MMQSNFNNRSVSQNQFAMVARAEIPRARFDSSHAHKTTFDAGRLIPVYLEEVLPGDHISIDMTAFVRMATPLFPVMDNFHLDSFFFFVPNRLVWSNWNLMMGEKRNPDDSVSFVVPQAVIEDGSNAPAVGSLWDYFGLPVVGQLPSPLVYDYSVSALPFRGYALIYNEWFRDENLQPARSSRLAALSGASVMSIGDGPDVFDSAAAARPPLRRGKRHDYFTSCLPWPLKGGVDVTLPLAGTAPISGLATDTTSYTTTQNGYETAAGGAVTYPRAQLIGDNVANPSGSYFVVEMVGGTGGANALPNIRADLSQATGATINALRLAVATQQLLELDARGGTRYVEILRMHFGVTPQDYRLQRPEYIGGGSSPVQLTPVAQTSATGISGGASPLGSLGAAGTSVARHGCSYAVMEHGFVFGIINVRADLTYQQGMHKMWRRRARTDYYWPVFANLGEQAVLRGEIYWTDSNTDNEIVFGYQERWAEYRYYPSMITGLFRSTSAGNIDEWHAAQEFSSAPTLGSTFIEDNPPMARILAGGSSANGMQFLGDFLFNKRFTRPLPMFSRPGLTRF